MQLGSSFSGDWIAMLYLVAILCPPLALLLNGSFGAMILNLVLALCCVPFMFVGVGFILYLIPIAHACVVISRKEADRRDERLVKAMAAGQAAAAANAKK